MSRVAFGRILCGTVLFALGATVDHLATPLGAGLVATATVLALACLAFRDSAWEVR